VINITVSSGVLRIFSEGALGQEFLSLCGSTNVDRNRGQREPRSGNSSLLVRGSTQFANERYPVF
jgi:hypothetical protein